MTEGERNILTIGSLIKWLQQPGLDQSTLKCLDLHLYHQCRWWGSKHLDHLLWFSRCNWCLHGMLQSHTHSGSTCCVAMLASFSFALFLMLCALKISESVGDSGSSGLSRVCVLIRCKLHDLPKPLFSCLQVQMSISVIGFLRRLMEKAHRKHLA